MGGGLGATSLYTYCNY